MFNKNFCANMIRAKANKVHEWRYNNAKIEINKVVENAASFGYMDALFPIENLSMDQIVSLQQELIDRGFAVEVKEQLDIDDYPTGDYIFLISWREEEVAE